MDNYILVYKTPVLCNDPIQWADWFEENTRLVARTKSFPDVVEPNEVSTVFLGLDHSFGQGGPPLLFETMVFGGEYDHHQKRYSTWEEALEGHKKVCAKIGITFEVEED